MSEFQGNDFPPENPKGYRDAQALYFKPGSDGFFVDHQEQDLRNADTLLEPNSDHPGSLALRGWINTELGFIVPVEESDACSDVATACFNAAADQAFETGHIAQVAEAYVGITSTYVYRAWSADRPLSDEDWAGYRTALADTADFVKDIDSGILPFHEAQTVSRVRYELMALMGLNVVRGDRRKPVRDMSVLSTHRQRLCRDSSLSQPGVRQNWHITTVQYRNEWTERRRMVLLGAQETTPLADSLRVVNLAPVLEDQTPTGINQMLVLQARNVRELSTSDADKEKITAVQRYLRQVIKN